ncbi:hypothetical protein GGQ54_002946 [Naumannella cuiyingiana]|uniref:Low molecular weight protein antigen 6 PH domain-containing protein n=1 Tax=Naumannella cuiyingiana TaxID=1347891 RepID=A0A7Z0DBB8_9ACTN|nr:hypothetical protein [Naumannella cuiyingiana]
MSDRAYRFTSRVSIIGAALGTGVLTVAAVLGWFALPELSRALFTIPQVLTLIGFLVALDAVIWSLSASAVRADAGGVTVRNGPRTRRYPWSDVAAVSYRRSDPWANLVLRNSGEHDPPRRPMLGIQRVDGERADRAVRMLRELHRAAS